MPRTVSTRPNSEGIEDLDGEVAVDLEALRLRISQAIKFQLRTWFLDTDAGIDYSLLRGHQTTAGIASQTITQTIRDEGGDEVIDVVVTRSSLDAATRTFSYQARVSSIHGGDFTVSTEI